MLQVVREILEAQEQFSSCIRMESLSINGRPATAAALAAAIDAVSDTPPKPLGRRRASRSVSQPPPSPQQSRPGTRGTRKSATKAAAGGGSTAAPGEGTSVCFDVATVPVLQGTRMHALPDAAFEYVASVMDDPAAHESWKVCPAVQCRAAGVLLTELPAPRCSLLPGAEHLL